MSLVHIRLSRISNNDNTASYKVESFDFLPEKNWEELGLLQILKIDKSYKFIASSLAEKNKLIPPEFYALSEEKRHNELRDKYTDYGLGAWSMCINHWAKTLITNGDYPEKYPIHM